jgi:hypothetical protein
MKTNKIEQKKEINIQKKKDSINRKYQERKNMQKRETPKKSTI